MNNKNNKKDNNRRNNIKNNNEWHNKNRISSQNSYFNDTSANKALRICFVNPPVLIKRPISEISSRFADEGFETSILLPKKLFAKTDKSLHHSGLMKKSRVYTYSTVNLPFVKSEQPIPITPFFWINAIKALKNNDVIHMWVPYYITSLKIIFMKKLFFRNKKLILTMDTLPGLSFSMGKSMDFIFKIYNKLFSWLIFREPNIITLYGKSLEPYAIQAGVPKGKIKVIPTGVELKKVSAKDKLVARQSLQKEFGIEKNKKIVLFAGLLLPRKGIDKIIKIAESLKQEKVTFVLAGDGPKRADYENEAKRLGLNIVFAGWRKDMKRFYLAADIFLLPAEGEGLPGVIMEAMSYGVPCVASNIPCIPDLILTGKSGILCEKDDSSKFSSAIKLLLRNSDTCKRMSVESSKKIANFSWDKAIQKYKELYLQ